MGTEQKVAVITGASQGIGAALVKAYRDRNYRVVATSRSIKPSNDDGVLSVAGDIADPGDRRARDRRSDGAVRPHRYAGQQRRHLHRQAVHPVQRGRFRRRARRQPRRLLPHHPTGDRGNGEAGQRPRRAGHHQPGRSRHRWRAVGAGVADQGRPERGHQVAGDRIRQARHPRERGLARRHQDADACAGNPRGARRPASRSATWARSRTSSMRSCTSKVPAS